MDIVKLCGAIIICTAAALVLKKLGSPVSFAVAASSVLMAALFTIPKTAEIIETVKSIAGESEGAVCLPAVLKCAAVAVICEISCNIAESCGEDTLSKALSSAGKIEIIFISLPLVKELFLFAKDLV